MTIPTARHQSETAPIAFPVLIADIGGTNVRFSMLPEPGAPLEVFETVATGDFADFSEAARKTVLDHTALRPKSVLMAIAGPVNVVPMRLTNAHWVIDPADIAAKLSLKTVIVLNDFEALSLSLPALRDDQLVQIGVGRVAQRKPRLVLGPGTGLGVGALHYGEPYFIPLPGEGGHMTIGPESERDFEIWPHLEKVNGRVSGEALLSGNGLARLYRGMALAAGREEANCRSGADVTARALAGEALADEAVDLFLTYLGRYAGNLALVFLPEGGVFIAGGIAPRLADRFEKSGFRAAFEAKEPHEAMLKTVPTFLVTEPRPAIAGMATFAEMPERFMMDFTGRRFDA